MSIKIEQMEKRLENAFKLVEGVEFDIMKSVEHEFFDTFTAETIRDSYIPDLVNDFCWDNELLNHYKAIMEWNGVIVDDFCVFEEHIINIINEGGVVCL